MAEKWKAVGRVAGRAVVGWLVRWGDVVAAACFGVAVVAIALSLADLRNRIEALEQRSPQVVVNEVECGSGEAAWAAALSEETNWEDWGWRISLVVEE